MRCLTRLNLVVIMVLIVATHQASAQQAASKAPATSTRWKVPDKTLHAELTFDNPDRRMVLAPDGLAVEEDIELLMLKHPEIEIVAQLPGPGEFQVVQTNPDALADVQRVRVEGGQGRAELVRRVPLLSSADVATRIRERVGRYWDPVERRLRADIDAGRVSQEEMLGYLQEKLGAQPLAAALETATLGLKGNRREARYKETIKNRYVLQRTTEDTAAVCLHELGELARRHPEWISQQQRTKWETAEPYELRDAYVELVECEILDEYLQQIGMAVEPGSQNFAAKLKAWHQAVYAAASGQVGSSAAAAATIARSLSAENQERLRRILSVKLTCRFVPAVDEADPNARWFAAQRVGASADGVASIRVRGLLDPGDHDQVDWWIVEDFASATMNWDRNARFRIEQMASRKEGCMLLRIAADGEEAIDYTFELRPKEPSHDGMNVTVHETPCTSGLKFPF